MIMNKKSNKFSLKNLVKAPLLAAIDAEISLHKKIQNFIVNEGFEAKMQDKNTNEIGRAHV